MYACLLVFSFLKRDSLVVRYQSGVQHGKKKMFTEHQFSTVLHKQKSCVRPSGVPSFRNCSGILIMFKSVFGLGDVDISVL